LGLKKAARVIGAVGLVAILNSPVKIASQEIMFQPKVIEQNISEKEPSQKEKHYLELSQAFHNSDLVFKGECIDVTVAFCGTVGDVCTNYVFESDTFYKHPAIDGIRKDPVKHTIKLWSDIRFPEDSISRFERAVMNKGGNGDLYELKTSTSTGIMKGDKLIIFASNKDLTHPDFFISEFCYDNKNNNKLLDDIASRYVKK
jgi:hypothetical protein